MHVYKGVRSCPTKTYYTLTNGKINSNQLYLSLDSYTMSTTHLVGCINHGLAYFNFPNEKRWHLTKNQLAISLYIHANTYTQHTCNT